jgi:hypothetical protein
LERRARDGIDGLAKSLLNVSDPGSGSSVTASSVAPAFEHVIVTVAVYSCVAALVT